MQYLLVCLNFFLLAFLSFHQCCYAISGCNPITPREVNKTEEDCKGINYCWKNNKCYGVNDSSWCHCLQSDGTICTKNQPGEGNWFAICQWGDKGCDTWHFLRGECTKEDPVVLEGEWPKIYCRLLGGTVDGEYCKNFKKWEGQDTNSCSLTALWNLTCPKIPK